MTALDMDNNRHEGRLVHITTMHSCPSCSCTVANVPMTFEFHIAATKFDNLPSSSEVIEALENSLPKEWFTIQPGEEWWLKRVDVS